VLAGEIFRYQDEDGNWYFTDDPPDRYESSVVPDIATSVTHAADTEPSEDLAGHLMSLYKPLTPIAYATLAVVSIRSATGEGSGFFCSDEGLILTNKHVVRPGATGALDERKGALDEKEQELQAMEADLKEARRQLRHMKEDLEGYGGLIADARDDETRSWAKEARRHLAQRYQSEQKRISGMERSLRTRKPELREARHKLGFEAGVAATGKRFDIVLKDGTELVADLLEVSDDQDLALLKLDGYRTPFLRLDPSQPLSQGTPVFAIGNPLGMQDAVTSGVITQITPEYLLTDAQLLPGSSGGPLIRENGEVIGINVARKVAAGTSKYAAGFGKVIPISVALQEFPTVSAAGAALPSDAIPIGPPRSEQTGTFGSHGTESGGGGSDVDGGAAYPEAFGPGQTQGFASGHDGFSASAPVRLIVPGQDSGIEVDAPAQPASGSLDFPPEGTVITPGISRSPE